LPGPRGTTVDRAVEAGEHRPTGTVARRHELNRIFGEIGGAQAFDECRMDARDERKLSERRAGSRRCRP